MLLALIVLAIVTYGATGVLIGYAFRDNMEA
jgi:hypothetical protein